MKNPYKKSVAVIGRHGFIGSALYKYLVESNFEVTSFPTEKTHILFHFGSPVHPPFEKNPEYHMNEILSSFMYLLPFCQANDIYFIYPSSALVYEKNTFFSKSKKILELYASCYPKTLGLRIFPVYGPGENRTVISQWCKAMINNQQPVVYGDGSQERDFIYIDDAIHQIINLVFTNKAIGVRDVGAGKPVSFDQIVDTINEVLGKQILPKYIPKPEGYSKGIVCQDPGITSTPIEEGIKKVIYEQI